MYNLSAEGSDMLKERKIVKPIKYHQLNFSTFESIRMYNLSAEGSDM